MSLGESVGNVQLMQRINRLTVLNYIRKNKEVSRPEIIKETGLSSSSITNIVKYLLDEGFIKKKGTIDTGEIGRRAQLLEYDPNCMHILGVNIEYDSLTIGITDTYGNLIRHKQFNILPFMTWESIYDILVNESKGLINQDQTGRPVAVGIAISAIVQDKGNLIISAAHKWLIRNAQKDLSKVFELPVYIVNSSLTKAVCCMSGTGSQDFKNTVFMDLSDGVGIVNFYKGNVNGGVIGEIGHTCVNPDGIKCFCGNTGCLELYCSKPKIIEDIKNLKGIEYEYNKIISMAAAKDKDVLTVLDEIGKYLGVALINTVNLFNPDMIYINGGDLLKFPFIYQSALKRCYESIHSCFTEHLHLETVDMGVIQSMEGLGIYVTDKIFSF